MKHTFKLCLPLLLFIWRLSALTVDTVITSDGSPGPYPLGRLFVAPHTIEASYTDSSGEIIPPFTYVEKLNAILFSTPIEAHREFAVRYKTDYYGLPKTYSLFPKTVIDTTLDDSALSIPSFSAFSQRTQNLTLSGYKSVGISVGSGGRMNIEQALDVKIFGEIAPQTELSANLNDQGTSLEGATREIGELDMVYISLTNPRFNTHVGDQFVSFDTRGILKSRKKIKGISAAYTGSRLYSQAFGAITGGKYTVETKTARQGFQGPYYLKGKGESDIISPISGTVRVLVDGKILKEGRRNEFSVDYDLGTVTFTPNFPLRDGQIIRIEYEYKSFDYQRTSFGTTLGYASSDSTLVSRGALWVEQDNKNHPIELDVDSLDQRLRNAGDNPPLTRAGYKIDPKNVPEMNEYHRLYRIDSSTTETFYVYAPFDQQFPEDVNGRYRVTFRHVGANRGEYVKDTRYTVDYRGAVYRYVGVGRGSFTAFRPIPMPQRSVMGEIKTSYNPNPTVSMNVDVAGTMDDHNTFSTIDDNDNNGSAVQSDLRLGKKTSLNRSMWLEANHQYISRLFPRKSFSVFDRKMIWDRETDTAATEKHIWESHLGGTLFPRKQTQFSYGQYIDDRRIRTHRIANKTDLAFGEIELTHNGSVLAHTDRNINLVQRQRTHVGMDFERFKYGLFLDDEWHAQDSGEGRGSIGGGAEFSFKPWSLQQNFYYTREKKGRSLFSSPDTADFFSWNQSIRHSPRPGWTFGGRSSYMRRRINEDIRTTVIVNAINDLSSAQTGFSSRQEYRLSSERASDFIQIPVYAGEGLGNYIYNERTEKYEPKTGGNYYVTQRQVYDSTGNTRVRKAIFRADWLLRPLMFRGKGILGDLTWSGSATAEEHIRAGDSLTALSWLPSYLSLNQPKDEALQYSHLFYRQEVLWRPDQFEGFHAKVHAKPSFIKQRQYRESALEIKGELGKRWEKWYLDIAGNSFALKRDGDYMSGSYDVEDRSVSFSQQFNPVVAFSIFLRQRAGHAQKSNNSLLSEQSVNRGNYFSFQPGITFLSGERGFAEASYTMSMVDIGGDLDYRMAGGLSNGISHVMSIFADIKIGKHFSLNAQYHGEYNKPHGNKVFDKGIHSVSMEIKAFL